MRDDISIRLPGTVLKSLHIMRCLWQKSWIRFFSLVRNLICLVLGAHTLTIVHLVLSRVQSRTRYLPSISTRLLWSWKESVFLIAISTPFLFVGPKALKIGGEILLVHRRSSLSLKCVSCMHKTLHRDLCAVSQRDFLFYWVIQSLCVEQQEFWHSD